MIWESAKFVWFRLNIFTGNLTNVKQLVKSGANVNTVGPHGWCPMMLATWNGKC